MKVFKMLTSEDIKRIKAQSDSTKRIEQLEKQKKILQDSIRKFQNNRSLNTMDEIAYRELQKENEELKKELALVKEDHQYDNLVHAKELKKALER